MQTFKRLASGTIVLVVLGLSMTMSGCQFLKARYPVLPSAVAKVASGLESGLEGERLAANGKVEAWSRHEINAFIEDHQFYIAWKKNGVVSKDLHCYTFVLPSDVTAENTLFVQSEAATADEAHAKYQGPGER
ncbi:MAG: hypothetical protein WCN95_05780 [bacterium]